MESYFDDVFVADDDLPTHVRNIEAVLRRIEERNVKISFDKLQLGFSDLQALGFDFKGHQYKPRYELREKFKDACMPTTREGVQQWLGLLNQFTRFIQPSTYREIMRVWGPLTGKKKRFQDYEPEELERTFELARTAVADIQPLYTLDDSLEIRLAVDASNTGTGAYLYQIDNEGNVRNVAMSAQTFSTPAKREWDTKTKELYAIYKSRKKLGINPAGKKVSDTLYRGGFLTNPVMVPGLL